MEPVLLGGVDVREVALEDLPRHFAVVGQSAYLFNETLAANLRLAATEAEIQDALVEVCRGRTVLVIAHRPSAVRTAPGAAHRHADTRLIPA